MTSGLHLLLIDDEPGDRLLLRRLLTRAGADASVVEADSVRSALAVLADRAVDCILLDYRLRGSSGLDLLDALNRQTAAAPPVIVLTGDGNEAVAVEALKRGASDYLVKNRLAADVLQRAIRHAVDLDRSRRERQRAQAELLQSEAHFRDLVEGSVQGIVIDRDGVPLFANTSFAKMFGYADPEEILALDSLDPLYVPAELPRINAYRIARRDNADAPTDYSFEGRYRDGSIRYIETRVRPISWQDAPAIQSTMIDVTARRRAEQALALRTAAAEAATDGILIADARTSDLPVIYASRSFSTLTGYAAEEIIGRNCRMLQGSGTSRAVLARLKAALAAGRPFRDEILNYRKGGEPFWNLLRIEPLSDAAGRLEYFVATQTDITAQKRLEQQLCWEKERLQVTLHSIGDAVITTDAGGRVEFMNPIAEMLTGWVIGEAQGLSLDRVFVVVDEESQQPADNPIKLCLQQQSAVSLPDNTVLVSRCGARHAIQESAAPIRTPAGDILGAVLVFQDVTEARGLAREVEYQARHDALTGLINRREFERRLEQALRSVRESDREHVLCFLDLDNFKIVNDTAGHLAGDALLKQIAHQLGAKLRVRDSLARLGGDEFSVLLESCPLDKARSIAEALIGAVRALRFSWQDNIYEVGLSVGLVQITGEARSVAQLLTQADVACYTAKTRGRNQVAVYHSKDGESARHHREMLRAAGLRNALENDRFRLYAQKIVALADGARTTSYFELLLRLDDADGGVLLPGAFIPAAERYNMMGAIDRWVIETALHQYPRRFGNTGAARIAINVSGNSLVDDGLLEFILAQFADSGTPFDRVCFEITETAAISNLAQATRLIRALKDIGCQVSLDDFGSGLSSFNYLKNFPLDYLKIDGSFMAGVANDPADRAMVESINHIGHTLGVRTIAEWVEDAPTLEQLRTIGIDFVQGFAIDRPRPLHEIGDEPVSVAV